MTLFSPAGVITKVADVIEPAIFLPYVRERITQVNAFFRSGIMSTVPDLTLVEKGGGVVNMPFWKAMGERAQLLDDNTDLDVAKLDAGKDKAVQHMRALVYGATDLSAALAGDDPMRAIADGIGDNWSTEINIVAIKTLRGAMDALKDESPEVNTSDISSLSGAASKIDGASFIDAAQQLGDMKVQISGVAMHSATEAALAKNDLIQFTQDSQGNIILRTFMGKTIIVDDALTAASAGVYDTFLFGPGALGYADGNPKVPVEIERNALINGGQEYLVQRRHFVVHPRGIAWSPKSGVPAKQSPSDNEIADKDNWTREYQPKNIRIVRFRHKL